MDENTTSASSCIILRLPLSRLKYLRNDFEEDEDGLRLDDFLTSMVEHTNFDDVGEILKIIPAMIDFFRDVDINGDGQMDWQEFTQSIISTGIQKDQLIHNERYKFIVDCPIQKPPAHLNCSCSKIIPQLKRIFVCVQDEIILFGLQEKDPRLLVQLKKFQLKKLNPVDRFNVVLTDKKAVKAGPNDKQDTSRFVQKNSLVVPYVMSMSFIESMSMLVVLRSDNTVEFFHLIVRTNTNTMSEVIEPVGLLELGSACTSCAVKDIPKQPVLLFGVGADNDIRYWTLTYDDNRVKLSAPNVIKKHTDYVLDVLIIVTSTFKYLASCSLDKKIRIFDLDNLHYRTVRTYVSGLVCMNFDTKSILVAGTCDKIIVGWDLDSQMDLPIFKLEGHSYGIEKVLTMGSIERCMSLDQAGNIRYWDIRKGGILDEDRLITILPANSEDKVYTFDCFQHVSSRYQGLVMAAQGKHQHIHIMNDATPNESPPITSLFAADLLMIITVHTKNIIQWNCLSGKQIKSYVYLPHLPNV